MSDYEPREVRRNRKAPRTCVLNVLLVLAVSIITLLVVPAVARIIRVQGDSMAPALQSGQLLFVNRLAYRLQPPRQGDIIVFRAPKDPETLLVKRVIALPGDRVSIRQGVVSVNGQSLQEPYVLEIGATTLAPAAIAEGTVFVLGDYRVASNDSREWGPLPLDCVIGRAEFSIWPPVSIS